MRSGNLLWGILLMVIGSLLLLQQLDLISIRWRELWEYWPLVLIGWGIVLLPIHKVLKAGLVLIMFAIVLFLLLTNFDFRNSLSGKVSSAISLHQYSEPMEGEVDQVTLTMKLFGGEFSIEDTTTELVDVRMRGRKSGFELKESKMAGRKHLALSMNETGRQGGRNRDEVKAHVRLNTWPAWNLELDAGSADLDLDLRAFSVREFSFKLNSTNGEFRLGTGETDGIFDLNASNIEIKIPSRSGCEIIISGSGNHHDFDDFEEAEKNVYRSENWLEASDKIRLRINASASSISID